MPATASYFDHASKAKVVRDLRACLDASGSHLYHYRDETELELDQLGEFAEQMGRLRDRA